MARVPGDQKHNKQTFIFVAVRALERTSYYGLRALLLLYMLNGDFSFSNQSAHTIYSFFISSIIFSQIIGAVLGDLLLGNKMALLVGGFIQCAGTALLCIPHTIALFSGLVLITIGCGLFSPNIFSAYCKKYLRKPELMDSGLSIFYTVVNIGAVLGTFIIGLSRSNFAIGFGICSFILLAAMVLAFFIEKPEQEEIPVDVEKKQNISVPYVLIAIMLSGIFWFMVDYANNGIVYLETNFMDTYSQRFNVIWSAFNGVFITISGVVGCIIWSFFDYSKLLKIIIGFFMTAIAYAVLVIVPHTPSGFVAILMMFSAFIFSIAEIHVGPVFYSIIARYSNPKYLAIMISLSFVPYRLFIFIYDLFSNDPHLGFMPLVISALTIAAIGIALLIFLLVKHKEKATELISEQQV